MIPPSSINIYMAMPSSVTTIKMAPLSSSIQNFQTGYVVVTFVFNYITYIYYIS